MPRMDEKSTSAEAAPKESPPEVLLAKIPSNLREMSPEELHAWARELHARLVAELQP